MSASNVRYSGQMESSYGEDWSWTADDVAGSYISFGQGQFQAHSFQTSIKSDPGIAVYPQEQQPAKRYADQLNGQKHKSKDVSQVVYCEICRVSCSGHMSLANHMNGQKHKKKEAASTPPSAAAASIPSSASVSPSPASTLVLTADAAEEVGSETAADASDIIGQEFIEEVKNEEGLVVSFYCRLCKCSSINPNKLQVHLEGRRHRYRYRAKIQSIYDVEKRYNTPGEQYVIQKHMDIYPPKKEMADIHNAISEFENALKLVSDVIAAEDAPSKTMDPAKTSEVTDGAKKTVAKMATVADKKMMETTVTEAAGCGEAVCHIKGAMRVGLLSKGLLLRGDSLAEHLVIICSEKPTRSLLQRIVDHLPAQLEIVSPMKKFQIEMRVEEAGLFVTIEEPTASFVITLTSMLVVDDPEPVYPPPPPSAPSDELSPGQCISALVLLRRTKWFHVCLCAMKSGTVVVHVLRDLCRRNATWTPLSEWAQMLLVEKSIFAAGIDIGPAEALRSFFECISSGILLPGGHGLMDPCEKVPTDVTAYLTEQQCEDLTVSAQQFLRLFLFRQLYKFLDVAKFKRSELRRRRRELRDQDDKPDERADDKKPKREDPAVKGNDAESENGDGDLVIDIDYDGNLVIVID